MQTVQVYPSSDAGPNDYAPTPAGNHHERVDEDPHDGDTTILVTVIGREVWGLDVSAIPDGSVIVSLRIRSVQKQSTAGAQTYRVGFVLGGVGYFTPSHVLGSGSAFVQADDEVAVYPVDSAPWTKQRLAAALLAHEQVAQAQGLPRPRLTECIVLADIILPTERPTADPAAVASSGTDAAVVGGANVAGVAGGATAAGIAPGGSIAGVRPDALVVVIGKGGAVDDVGPSAIPAAVGPSVRLVGLVPDATAATVAPAADVEGVDPPTGEAA